MLVSLNKSLIDKTVSFRKLGASCGQHSSDTGAVPLTCQLAGVFWSEWLCFALLCFENSEAQFVIINLDLACSIQHSLKREEAPHVRNLFCQILTIDSYSTAGLLHSNISVGVIKQCFFFNSVYFKWLKIYFYFPVV